MTSTNEYVRFRLVNPADMADNDSALRLGVKVMFVTDDKKMLARSSTPAGDTCGDYKAIVLKPVNLSDRSAQWTLSGSYD